MKPAEPPKSLGSSKPPPRARGLASLLAQSWLTIAASTVPGFIFVTQGNRDALLWPAGIAALFTMQLFMRMSDPSGKEFPLIAGAKLIFAYLAFAIGATAALVYRSL